MRSRRYPPLVLVFGTMALLLAACGNGEASTATDPDTTTTATTTTDAATTTTDAPTTTTTVVEVPDDRPVIVATTSIWGDVVRQATCDRLAEVVVLVPAGGDAHSFEPSFRDRATMAGASVVVANGLDLEEQLIDTIEAVEAEGVPVFRVADHVDNLLELGDDHGHDHGHSHGAEDPHLWFDPVRVAGALPALGEAVAEATDLDARELSDCVAAYQEELLATAATMDEELAAVPAERRLLVTSHESLGYFADRFDFRIIGTVIAGTSSLAETNPAALEALAQDILSTGVPAIFANAEASTADVDALAKRLPGVVVVPLLTESLGGPGSGADTYLGFLRQTATTVATALS